MNSLVQAIVNIGKTLPALTALAVIVAFIAGLIFFIKAIVALARPTNSGNAVDTAFVTTHFAIGVFLMSLGSIILAGTGTLFETSTVSKSGDIFSYAPNTIGLIDDATTRLVIRTIVGIVQFVGLLGVIRGLFLFSAYSKQQVKSVSAGIVFVVAGVLAMNFPLAVRAFSLLFVA